jgi:hypothetical protein
MVPFVKVAVLGKTPDVHVVEVVKAALTVVPL